MGWNTTVVVMNDALSSIEGDPEFGRKLAGAVRAAVDGGKHDVSAGGFCNAAVVVETHYSSGHVLVRVGMNDGKIERLENADGLYEAVRGANIELQRQRDTFRQDSINSERRRDVAEKRAAAAEAGLREAQQISASMCKLHAKAEARLAIAVWALRDIAETWSCPVAKSALAELAPAPPGEENR